MPISIQETYQNRNILLLGGNGFLGKVLLLMLLKKIPLLNHIFLILRGTKTETAEERFIQTIQTSPVFAPLKAELKEEFLPFIKGKTSVISGDVSLPDLGIKDQNILAHLKTEIDLVINSAGLVTFNPEPAHAIGSNLKGAIHAGEFVKQATKAKLVHISTCFVSGNRNGLIPEGVNSTTPNGQSLDILQELEVLEKIPPKEIGPTLSRANQFGWPNIYTYTKALAEFWLDSQKEKIPFAIVRPSIVESSVEFPFPGWNEGFNTSAPLVQSTDGWYPFVIAKPEFALDIIPVDILCTQIIKVGALLLHQQHQTIYQCATSSRHPLSMKRIMELTRGKQRDQLRSHPFSLQKWLKTSLNIRAISPKHPLSSFNLYALCSKLPIDRFKSLRRLSRHLQRLSKLHEILLPFLYENSFIFASKLIDEIQVLEEEFNQTVEQIDWDYYWPNIHISGLQKWCFPKIEA